MGGGRPYGDSLPRPWLPRRLGCFLVDVLVVAFAVAVVRAVLSRLLGTNAEWFAFLMDSIVAAIFFAYAAYMHAKYGKTLGKMLGACSVVDLDGDPCGTRRAVIRAFFTTGPGMFQIVVLAFSQVGAYLYYFFVVIYYIANAVTLLGNSEQERGLHDFLAGTRVIWDAEVPTEETDEEG